MTPAFPAEIAEFLIDLVSGDALIEPLIQYFNYPETTTVKVRRVDHTVELSLSTGEVFHLHVTKVPR